MKVLSYRQTRLISNPAAVDGGELGQCRLLGFRQSDIYQHARLLGSDRNLNPSKQARLTVSGRNGRKKD